MWVSVQELECIFVVALSAGKRWKRANQGFLLPTPDRELVKVAKKKKKRSVLV